jgi:hypothetical protein
VKQHGRLITDYLRDILEPAQALQESLASVSSIEELRADRKTVLKDRRRADLTLSPAVPFPLDQSQVCTQPVPVEPAHHHLVLWLPRAAGLW